MVTLLNDNSDFVVLLRNYVLIALSWTFLCFLSAYWNISAEKEKTLELAQKEAMTVFDKDQAFRFWATDHEGVYVPVTDRTPPNEYLSHILERDLVTPSGKQLTLMNPAYMLRQVMSHYATLYSTYGHLTSLQALNPINKPDAWETKALQEFNDGKEKVMTVTLLEGNQFLRLMKPVYTKVGCLKCHAHQGYKLGDVRGGLSVSIPLAPYREIETNSILQLYISHLFFFFSGISAVIFTYYRSKNRILARVEAAQTLQQQSEKIKLFAYSVVHDLKNPVFTIHGLTNLLRKRYQNVLNEKGINYCENISKSAAQLELLVGQISEYISAKEHPLKIIELDFLEICQSVREEYASQLRERNVQWSEPSLVSMMRADRICILRIIRNFVDNALKYGGETMSRIDVTYKESKEFHTLCVSNDGNAIVPGDFQNLFVQFNRNCDDTRIAGVGLGLAIIKDLVELHDGEVWGESDSNEGVNFFFTISKKL